MHAPQIILIILTTWAVFGGDHTGVRVTYEGKNLPLASAIMNASIMMVLLIWGGFFG
jgi:hypothetical protein